MQHQTGAQYSAVEWTEKRVTVRSIVALASLLDPPNCFRNPTRNVNFLRSNSEFGQNVNDLPSFMSR